MRMQRQRQRLNKYESKQSREAHMEHVFHGEGLYVYRNRTNGDLQLPKPTTSGTRYVAPGQEWQGDNYYMRMVPQEAILVRTIVSPQQERDSKMLQEQKLILDQPDTVTTQGQVEHVMEDKPQTLNEGPATTQGDILLNEDPLAGVEIMRN